ncbi:MAG: hypothetical protein V7707_10600 [Motiliproteus sp.]
MQRTILYPLRNVCGIALLLSITTMGYAADSYYLKDDGSSWLSQDGKEVHGISKSSLSICKQDESCRDLKSSKRGQRNELWYEINEARRQLEESESDRVKLDAETGRALYNNAGAGPKRIAE